MDMEGAPRLASCDTFQEPYAQEGVVGSKSRGTNAQERTAGS